MLFQASKGNEPTKSQLDVLRQSLPKLDAIPHTKEAEKEVKEFVIGKYWGERLEAEITKPISEKTVHALKLEIDSVSM